MFTDVQNVGVRASTPVGCTVSGETLERQAATDRSTWIEVTEMSAFDG